MMKYLAVGLILIAISVGTMGPETILATGTSVSISPTSGELGTEVELRSRDWTPNVEVRIYAAVSSSREFEGAVVQFVGPVATTNSAANGEWLVRLKAEAVPGLAVPNEPGFIVYRAESDDLPEYLKGANLADFAVVLNGQRLRGSGEIRVTVQAEAGASEQLTFIGWRQLGYTEFISNRLAGPLPLTTAIARLDDGEWEVAVEGTGTLVASSVGDVHVVAGRSCDRPGCSYPLREYRAVRFTIRDGSIVVAELLFASNEQNAREDALRNRDTGVSDRQVVAAVAVAAALGLVVGLALGALSIARATRKS